MPSCVVSDDPKDSKVELSFSKKLLYILFHLMWAINLMCLQIVNYVNNA